jgi:capsular exopolysaccharide synthesis family protein
MSQPSTSKVSLADLWAKAQVLGRRYLVTLRKYWWIPVLTLSLGLVVSAWKGAHLSPSYVSTAQMVITGQFQIEGAVHSEESTDYLGTQFALIQSDQVAQRARKRVLSVHSDWMPTSVGLSISKQGSTSFVLIQATGVEPLYTQAYLDAVMQEYMALNKEMRAEKSDSMTSALRNQMILLDKETTADQDELLRFQKESNIGFLKGAGNSAGTFLAGKQVELADLKAKLSLLDTLDLDQNIDREQLAARANATAQNGGTSSNAQQGGNGSISTLDPTLANSYGPMTEYLKAKQDVGLLKAKKTEQLKVQRPENPAIQDLDKQIAMAENLMETYRAQSIDVLKSRRESIVYQIKNLQNVISEWEIKAMDLSQKLAEYDRIQSKLDRDHNQYDLLIKTVQSVGFFKNVEQDRLSVLENASPAVETKASLAKIIFGGMASGLLAGLAILFGIDKLDDRIISLIECKGSFRELGVLGQIPGDGLADEMTLLIPYDPRTALWEAFRALRSSILFLPVDGAPPKSFMIMSAESGEGKTAIAYNLAATLAYSGAKTLLVDCNLVKGRLHETFGISAEDDGFLNVLQQQVAWKEVVKRTSIDKLFLLPRGNATAYPAEHFFGTFLKEVYEEYDYIIFDSAPILENVEALSFAPLIDGVLFVVRFGQTSSGQARRALDFLNARQVNVLGLICNQV